MTATKERTRGSAGVELAAAVNRAARADAPSVGKEGKALPPTIEGVALVQLTSHHDDRGSLTPVLDVRHPFWVEPIVYAYAITIRPGRIKGWGMHRLQSDRYFVCRGSVRVVLFDGREDSPSCGRFAEFFFTDATPGLLRIPPGVWHADQNWSDSDAQVINFPTHPYDPGAPDKQRIDPHSGVIPFDWRLRDG
jgi:dTDP-4-dehydrorhamnose 3,5-epimerase